MNTAQLIDAVRRFLAQSGCLWSGTASELLDRLSELAAGDLPKTAAHLTAAMRAASAQFVGAGIDMQFERTGHDRRRLIRLTGQHESPRTEVTLRPEPPTTSADPECGPQTGGAPVKQAARAGSHQQRAVPGAIRSPMNPVSALPPAWPHASVPRSHRG